MDELFWHLFHWKEYIKQEAETLVSLQRTNLLRTLKENFEKWVLKVNLYRRIMIILNVPRKLVFVGITAI